MKLWYATFGHGQTHPLTGQELVYHYTLVPAETQGEAQALMMRTVFGQRWAFLYEHPDGQRGAGVQQFSLREIPFIPPSPLSDVVWQAYEAIGEVLNATEWIELVSQPIELAWHRLQEAAVRAGELAYPQVRLSGVDPAAELAAAILTPDACDCWSSPEIAEGPRIDCPIHGADASNLPHAPVEQAEAASPVSDRSLTTQVAQPPEYPSPAPIADVEAAIAEYGGVDPDWAHDLIAQRNIWEDHARIAHRHLDQLRATVEAVIGRCEQNAENEAQGDGTESIRRAIVWRGTAEQLRRALAGAS